MVAGKYNYQTDIVDGFSRLVYYSGFWVCCGCVDFCCMGFFCFQACAEKKCKKKYELFKYSKRKFSNR
jgi:hypothetical protein